MEMDMMFLLQSAQTIINAQLRAGDGIKSYAYTCTLNPYSEEQPRVMRANGAILLYTWYMGKRAPIPVYRAGKASALS
jgi:hypothetical protein